MPELPTARANRLVKPSWKDTRLVLGVALVLASTVLGAWAFKAKEVTVPVYAAAVTLVPGQRLAPTELVPVDVRLGEAAPLYVRVGQGLSDDLVVMREVRPGEMLLASAVGPATQSDVKPVMLPVDQDSASVVVTGSVVDIWVNDKISKAGVDSYGSPRKLVESAPVSRAPEASASRFGSGRATTGVQVMVPTATVAKLIAAIDQGSRITLVPALGSAVKAS